MIRGMIFFHRHKHSMTCSANFSSGAQCSFDGCTVISDLDNLGREKLHRFVFYGANDILEYAPVMKAHLKDGGMTLGALCAAAIEQSDNTAGNLLLDTIG